MFGELTEVLRDLRIERPAPRPEQFKPPQFNGDGDVDLFIQHFSEVAEANQWNQVATLLHLREALQGSAREYGRPASVEAAFTALRSRYGLTTKEARTKLSSLKRDSRSTLHEHSIKVEKLVRKAFGELPCDTQAEMMLDTFCSTLNNTALQRHLLAIRPESLTEAVQHGNEFLQVRSDRQASDQNKVRALEETEEEVQPVDSDPLSALTKMVQQLAETMVQLQKKVEAPAKKPKDQKCWGCQKTGHTRKECSTHPWPKSQGNEATPQ